MDLIKLFQLADSLPAYQKLLDSLKSGKTGVIDKIVMEEAKPFLIASLFHKLNRPVLVITAHPETGKKMYEQLINWSDASRIRLFPESDILPYQRVVSDSSTETDVLQVMSSLTDRDTFKGEQLIVTSAAALTQKLPPAADFKSTYHIIKAGIEVDPSALLSRWEKMGYKMENIVEIPGTMSKRGGIVDIYPPCNEGPTRLEFLGNTIESIRLFNPASQRSQKAVNAVAVSPATTLLTPLLIGQAELESITATLDLSNLNDETRQQNQQELAMLIDRQRSYGSQFYAPLFNRDTLLDYMPQNTLIIMDEPRNIQLGIEELDEKASGMRKEKIEHGELPANLPAPYFTYSELEQGFSKRQQLNLSAWQEEEGTSALDFHPALSIAGQLPSVIEKVKQLLKQEHRVIIVSQQASRLSELFEDEDIYAPVMTGIEVLPAGGSLTLVQGSLEDGWTLGNDLYLLTDTDVFGFAKQRRSAKKRAVSHQKLSIDFSPGDYAVHIEHGIGRFTGVTTLNANGNKKEYLVLKYASGDRLYVPIEQIDRVNRYIGADDGEPILSRLHTQEWIKTKQKAKEAVEEVAQELLTLYASREVIAGYAASPDTVWQAELESSFPYVETPDQLKTVEQVKEDMEKPSPMDRLVCGDVGYGKTEIAVRAAFKTVMDGKQVAILVPTTVLAQQHFQTFSQRMAAFPVEIEVLSRFQSPKEQKQIVEGLTDGSVDICIGTHRLLQKDISFKELGLLIIDEEQRFGVAHKEYLKQMRKEVDVLTLSATPIPRTLHMSLTGVRDMSTIETPPEDRLPIKTFVAEYNERLVREAILRELERNGQVIFVHNRVQSIDWVASQVRQIVPEAKVVIAHGQMPEEQLESVMLDFTQGNSDVLVCTTIIESGLDMPNVNTLIVNQADILGLTQLYQLRGRVGRGANLAYAYFLFEKGKRLTPMAEKRLKTICEATELGSGFSIAMKDLEIRGAGTLLGMRQSGQISAVGFNLYCKLLSDAVAELKAKRIGIAEGKPKPPELPSPSIDLPMPAYIPDEYVSDLDTRLELYQRLVKVDKLETTEDFSRELKDRFGALPVEVQNLLYAVKIKILTERTTIASVSHEPGQIILTLHEGLQFDKHKLVSLLKYGVKTTFRQLRLDYKRPGNRWQQTLENILKELAKTTDNQGLVAHPAKAL